MAMDVPATIPHLLAATVARVGEQQALATIADGQMAWRTWSEIDVDVRRFAARLKQASIGPGDRVAQWAPNSYAWIVTDLALLSLGAVHVPLHASLARQQIVDLLRLSGVSLLIVDDACRDADPLGEATQQLPLRHGELTATPVPSNLEGPLGSVEPAQLATLLFTSGTTGDPRGVMLSHENLTANTIATTEAVGAFDRETRLCFLPLSHIYARTCDLYSWLYRGSQLVLAENRDTIFRDCQISKPRVLNAVPYFYQKVAQRLPDAEPGALKQLLGGALERCFCGGAAIAPEVESFFERQGLPILSGYGLSEASPVVSATALAEYQAGSVGKPLANLQVEISDSGEVLVRGPSVMLGYWNDPTATDESIVDGWLHTGDLGSFDALGNLRIVGRRKELIVLSTGKNVAPSRVEHYLAGSPLIEHVCVVGDGRKCLAALIVPNPEALRQEIRQRKLWVWSRRRAVTHPRIRELYRQEIDRLLSVASAEEQVACFTLLSRNFSADEGELTAKLSLRRQTIAIHFAGEIERMYAP